MSRRSRFERWCSAARTLARLLAELAKLADGHGWGDWFPALAT